MLQTSTHSGSFARCGLISSVAGAVLLSTVILLSCWYERQINASDGMSWYDGLSFFPALHGVWSGALIGAATGISAWAMLTRRRMHSLVTALAGAVLAAELGSTLYIIYEVLAVPRVGIVRGGGMMQPFGFVET